MMEFCSHKQTTDNRVLSCIVMSTPLLGPHAVDNTCTYCVSARSSLIRLLQHLQQSHKLVDVALPGRDGVLFVVIMKTIINDLTLL